VSLEFVYCNAMVNLDTPSGTLKRDTSLNLIGDMVFYYVDSLSVWMSR